MSSLIGDIAGWATDVIESLGYIGLAMIIALENVFPPIPSEAVLPLAGFLTGLDKANAWFDDKGGLAVLLCRVVPIVRSLISIPAGIRRMPLLPFIGYTAVGAGVWNSVLIGAGWALGDNWDEVEQYVGYLQYVVIALVIVGAVLWFWKRNPFKSRTTA